MDYTVQLQGGSDQDQDEEAFSITFADGRNERMRLHDYDRVYAIPGLYEEVVQRQLECGSPAKVADVVVRVAQLGDRNVRSLRVLDVGAGNGVVGELLRQHGVEMQVGADVAAARHAAERDRPSLYAEYLIGELSDLHQPVRELELDVLLCVAALGFDHITAAQFAELWDAFPPGAVFVITVNEELAQAGGSDIGDYLAELRGSARGTEVVLWERFRHRLTMAGEPIYYVAVAARKLSAPTPLRRIGGSVASAAQIGTAGLQGWRRKVGDVVAEPVAQRTPLDAEQVRAAVGALFFALSVMYVVKTVGAASREMRRS